MKIGDYWATHYEFTGKTSDIARTLMLSGIAIIWVFATAEAGAVTVPRALIWPGLMILCGLVADLLQYAVSGVIWGVVARQLEKARVPATEERDHSPWLSRPATAFYWVKIVLVLIAYLLLARFFIERLVTT